MTEAARRVLREKAKKNYQENLEKQRRSKRQEYEELEKLRKKDEK